MTPTEIRAAIRDVLDILENGRGSEYENWRQLIRSLDGLAWAYHCSSPGIDTESEDAYKPSTPFIERYKVLCALSRTRFPEFGVYDQLNLCTTDTSDPEPHVVGDAIDDLASIAGDLQAAEWRWSNASEGHALYMFRLEFGLHTMEHVRHLQVYLIEYMLWRRPHWAGIY